jgi:hypothetical protein
MSQWGSRSARKVLKALHRIGPKMLARIAKKTGLTPNDL